MAADAANAESRASTTPRPQIGSAARGRVASFDTHCGFHRGDRIEIAAETTRGIHSRVDWRMASRCAVDLERAADRPRDSGS